VRVDRFSDLNHAGARNRAEIVVDSGHGDGNARSGRCEIEVVASIGIRADYFSRGRKFEILGCVTELRQTDGFWLEERLRRIAASLSSWYLRPVTVPYLENMTTIGIAPSQARSGIIVEPGARARRPDASETLVALLV
jgi:hypothetical protein